MLKVGRLCAAGVSAGGTNGKNFPTLQALQNISAIYSLVFTDSDASGHADYIFTDINGKVKCASGCNFNMPILTMDIWILN